MVVFTHARENGEDDQMDGGVFPTVWGTLTARAACDTAVRHGVHRVRMSRAQRGAHI